MAYVAKKDKAFEDVGASPWVIRRRSDGRIKLFRSTGDVRAWSHCKEDRRQYILDLIIADIKKCAGSVIPLDLLAKALLACQGGAAGAGAGGGITKSLSSGAGKTKIRKDTGSIDKGDEYLTSENDATKGASGIGESGMGESIAGVDESALGGSHLDKTNADLGQSTFGPKSVADESGVGKSVTLTSGAGEMRTEEPVTGGSGLGPTSEASDVGGKEGTRTGPQAAGPEVQSIRSGVGETGLEGADTGRSELGNEGEVVGVEETGLERSELGEAGAGGSELGEIGAEGSESERTGEVEPKSEDTGAEGLELETAGEVAPKDSKLEKPGEVASRVGRCATKGQQTEDPCLKYKKSFRCQGVVTVTTGKNKAKDDADAAASKAGAGGAGGPGGVGGTAGAGADGGAGAGAGAGSGAGAGAGSGAGADGGAGAGAGAGSGAGAGGGSGADDDAAGAGACRSEGQVCKPKTPECALKKFKSCGSLPQEKSPCSRLTEIDANIARQRKIAMSQGLATYIKNVVMCDDPCNKSAALTVIEEMLCTIQRQQKKMKAAECNTTGEEKDVERLRSIIEDYRSENEELRNQVSQAYCTEKKHKKLIIQQSERINQLELWAAADRNELDRLKKQLCGRGEEEQACHEMMRSMMKEIEYLKVQNYEQLTAQQEHECQMNRLEEYERELCKVKQERDGLRRRLQKSSCCQEIQVDKDREKLDKMLCQLGECQRDADAKERELNSLRKEIECLKNAKHKKEKEMEWALSKVKGELDKKECIIKQFGNQLVQLQNQLQERECRLREAENSLMEMREQMFELKVKFDANRDEVDKLYEQLCEKGKSLQDLQEQTNSFHCSSCS